MKNNILKTSNGILGLILGSLGFYGCQGNNMAEYGMPNATYKISGKVTDQTSKPIQNIEVSLQEKEWDKDKYNTVKKAITNENGDYEIKYNHLPREKFHIVYQDTDGPENGGEFEDMTQGIEFKADEYVGGSGSWYKGEAKRTANAVLTLKDTENK